MRAAENLGRFIPSGLGEEVSQLGIDYQHLGPRALYDVADLPGAEAEVDRHEHPSPGPRAATPKNEHSILPALCDTIATRPPTCTPISSNRAACVRARCPSSAYVNSPHDSAAEDRHASK